MMTEIFQICAIAFITGIIVKLTDVIVDDKKKILFMGSDILFGILYGSLIGYMISKYPNVAPIWLGVVIGALITKKFDALSHMISLPFIILNAFFFGLHKFSIGLTALFTIICIADEILNDYFDKKKSTIFVKFMRLRPLLELTALLVSIITLRIEIFLAIFCFDVGYIIIRKTISR